MKLSKEIKDLIRKEYEEFKESMYAGKSLKERQELDQFFTPPEISIRLIEELSDLSGNILDPTCGSGNLLAAALIAGADSDKVFGNEYDETMVVRCRERLNKVCDLLRDTGRDIGSIQDWQIHQGNALHKFAVTFFGEDYDEVYFDGCIQKAARNKKLNNESYDAYLQSSRFKKKYPEDYKRIVDENTTETAEKQSEQSNTFNLWG
jgi:SAM-dependent methyltransferase